MDRFFRKALSPLAALLGVLLAVGSGPLEAAGNAGRDGVSLGAIPSCSDSEGDIGAKLDPDGFRVELPEDLGARLGSLD